MQTPSLEVLPTKAKEDPSPHEMRLSPAGHQPSIFWVDFIIIITIILLLLLLLLLLLSSLLYYNPVFFLLLLLFVCVVYVYRPCCETYKISSRSESCFVLVL